MKNIMIKLNKLIISFTFLLVLLFILNIWVFKYSSNLMHFLTMLLYILLFVSIIFAFITYNLDKTKINYYLIYISFIPLILVGINLFVLLYKYAEAMNNFY